MPRRGRSWPCKQPNGYVPCHSASRPHRMNVEQQKDRNIFISYPLLSLSWLPSSVNYQDRAGHFLYEVIWWNSRRNGHINWHQTSIPIDKRHLQGSDVVPWYPWWNFKGRGNDYEGSLCLSGGSLLTIHSNVGLDLSKNLYIRLLVIRIEVNWAKNLKLLLKLFDF